MNLQEHFNIKRFVLLFKNDMLLNYKSYFFSAIGYSILLYFVQLFFMTNFGKFAGDEYLGIFIFSLIVMFIFAGSSFPALNTKNSTLNYILTPGSIFEKFIIQFIIRIVLVVIFLLGSFWVISFLSRATALQLESVKLSGIFIDTFRFPMLVVGYTGVNHKLIIYLVALSFGIGVFSFRLFFKKFAFVKSTILIVGLLFLLFFVMSILSKLFFPLTTNGLFDISPFYMLGNPILLGFRGGSAILTILSFLLILPLGYYKLKEKQL